MRCDSRWTLAAVSLACVLFAGCKDQFYRAETELNADGTIRRAIYQPTDGTPEWALNPENWAGTTYAVRIETDDWRGPIDQLPVAPSDDDHDYFAAWGEFDAPSDMPQTFIRPAPDGLPPGVLAIDYQQQDFVLLVEHRWRETLTDVVTLDDLHQAREELAEMVVAVTERVLAEALGDEYDVSGLAGWLRGTATPWFYEITDVYFDVSARRDDTRPDKLERALEPIFARHGLSLRDESGELVKDEQLQLRLRTFARDVIQQHLKRRDGKPVPPEVTAEILQWLGLEEPPAGTEPRQRLPEATKKVVSEMYGSEEGFGEAVKPLMVRILGLYQGFSAEPTRFEYQMRMPGSIVETNGAIVSEDRTRWDFRASEAYPFGYAMHCRSFDERPAVEERIFGRRVLADRDTQLRFVTLASENEKVLEALRLCAEQGSPRPLIAARDRTAPGSPDTKAFDAMLELLGVQK